MRDIKDAGAEMGGRIWIAMLAAIVLAISGCGGSSSSSDNSGGGGGVSFNEEPATISGEDDAKESAVAAQQTAEQAINDENSGAGELGGPGGVTLANMSRSEQMLENALDIIESSTLPSAVTNTVSGPCGGNATVETSQDANTSRVQYNNFCSDGYVIDGYYQFVFSENSSNFTSEYDYTVTGNGETYSFSGSCNQNVCTDNYVGSNGQTYRTQDVSVSGDGSSGYSVSARVYSGDLGYVDYEATGLVECDAPDYGFQSGSITITDSTGSEVVSVSFSDCNSYTVMYKGNSYTVNY